MIDPIKTFLKTGKQTIYIFWWLKILKNGIFDKHKIQENDYFCLVEGRGKIGQGYIVGF